MIRLSVLLFAAAAPAAAQVSPIGFEAAKLLPVTSGQWTYAATPTGSEARFGSALAVQCDRSSRIVTISRPGMAAAVLTITTDTAARNLPLSGRLIANDPLLDAITFSRGRFLVAGGGSTLAIPNWPEAARSIEDCRS